MYNAFTVCEFLTRHASLHDRVIGTNCHLVCDENALWNHGASWEDFLHAI